MEKKPPKNEGRCISCLQNEDESYEHILTTCEGFEDLRNQYIKEEIEWFKEKAPNRWKEEQMKWMLRSNKSIEPNTGKSRREKELRIEKFWKEFMKRRKVQVRSFLL